MKRLTAAGRLVVVLLALVAGVTGWFGVSLLRAGGDAVSAADAVDLYSCPLQGARSVGQLFPGDQVVLIGTTADRWAVIRDPHDTQRAVWVPLAKLSFTGDVGALPDLGCEVDPTTATTVPPTTVVASTVPGETTTTVLFQNTTTTEAGTTTTISTDRTAPRVSLSANRPYVYVSPAAKCPTEAEMEVEITVSDPTTPLTIRSITASWNVGGPQSAGLSPVGGNRFKLVVINGGPTSGEVPMTLTATASDGAGNVGTGTLLVTLRSPNSYGCA